MKRIIHFTLLILGLNFCFLFSPRPTPETHFWGEYIPLNAHMGFIRNGDANEFLESAISPSALMRENYVRQNRPLYVIAASGVGYAIYYTSNLFGSIHILNLEKSIYIAYVCLNFIILLLALILLDKIANILTGGKISYTIILLLSVFTASNFMTKAFFWTAHQQMFAFLMPLLSIYICLRFNDIMTNKWWPMLFFLFGIGMLMYGSFLIVFSVCIVYLCYILNKQRSLFTFHSFKTGIISFVLFVIPTILWVLFLKYKGVTYYNHEVVRYRQLVWIMDTLSISTRTFLSAFYINLVEFLKTISKLYLFVVLLFSTLFLQKIKKESVFKWNQNSKLILLNLFCFGCFFIVLGYYANRLTFTLMPIILCLSVANAGDMLNNKKVQISLGITVAIWHTINVLSYGPFS